jgi:hypothetical protein
VALGCPLKEFATCAGEPGFRGYITTIPARRAAVGANIFLTHWWNISHRLASDVVAVIKAKSSMRQRVLSAVQAQKRKLVGSGEKSVAPWAERRSWMEFAYVNF